MPEEERKLLVQQLNFFKSLKVISDKQKRYGVVSPDWYILVPVQYLHIEIFLRVNKFYPYSMKPIIWIVNHDHKEAHIDPDLKMSKFRHFTTFTKYSGDTLRGFFNTIINDIRYQDVPIERVTPNNILKFSYQNKEIDRPIV